MSQVNANRSPGPEDVTRDASGEDVAQRGGDRVAAGARGPRGPRRGS